MPVNTALPTLTGTPADSQPLAIGAGAWTGTTPISWAIQRDGVTVQTFTSLPASYIYSAATDDGAALTVLETTGSSDTASSAPVIGTQALTPVYPLTGNPPFNISDQALSSTTTVYDGFWTALSANKFSVKNHQLYRISGTGIFPGMVGDAGSSDVVVGAQLAIPSDETTSSSSVKYIYVRYNNTNTYLRVAFSERSIQLLATVSGTTTTVSASGNVENYMLDGDRIEVRVAGNYLQVWTKRGSAVWTHNSVTSTLNGGLGYQISSTFSGTKICIAVGNKTYTTPTPVFYDFYVKQPDNGLITFTPTIPNIDARLRLAGASVNTSGPLQALVQAVNGPVISYWETVTLVAAPTGDTGKLANALDRKFEGVPLRIWVRDAGNKETIASVDVTFPIIPRAAVFGTNRAGSRAYVPARPYVNLMNNANWNTSSTISPPIDSAGNVNQAISAYTVGLGVPKGDGTPVNMKISWDGTGTVMAKSDSITSNIVQTTSHTSIFTVTGKWNDVTVTQADHHWYIFLSVTSTDPSDFVRNIVITEADPAQVESGLYHTGYLANKAALTGPIRLMDMFDTNNNGWWKDPSDDLYKMRDPLTFAMQPLTGTHEGIRQPAGVSTAFTPPPLSHVVGLAAATGRSVWINVPVNATTDWAVGVVGYLRDGMDAAGVNQPIYVESGNEPWNFQFSTYGAYANAGLAYWPDDESWQRSMKMRMKIHNIIMNALGDAYPDMIASEKLVRIVNVQTVTTGDFNNLRNLTDPALTLTSANTEAVAVAPYYAANLMDAGYTTDPAVLGPRAMAGAQTYMTSYLPNMKTAVNAAGFRLVCYEGYSLNRRPGNGGSLDDMLLVYSYDEVIYQPTKYMLGEWQSKFGDVCCVFAEFGRPAVGSGYWGFQSYEGENPSVADYPPAAPVRSMAGRYKALSEVLAGV